MRGRRPPKQLVIDIIGLRKYLSPKEIAEILCIELKTIYNVLYWRRKQKE